MMIVDQFKDQIDNILEKYFPSCTDELLLEGVFSRSKAFDKINPLQMCAFRLKQCELNSVC